MVSSRSKLELARSRLALKAKRNSGLDKRENLGSASQDFLPEKSRTADDVSFVIEHEQNNLHRKSLAHKSAHSTMTDTVMAETSVSIQMPVSALSTSTVSKPERL